MIIYYNIGPFSVRFNVKQRFQKPWVVWDDDHGKRVEDGEYTTSDAARARARELAGDGVPAA